MSDLPSREEVREDFSESFEHTEDCPWGQAATAYMSGRLVDRETIERRIRDAMTLETDGWADAIVVAVLGEA